MYTKQEIILRYYQDGKSQRSISRSLGISRKTVQKYIDLYQSSKKESGSVEGVQSAYLSEPPVYHMGSRVKRKLTEEVSGEIDKLLEDNALKKSSGLGKQVLKKIDILEHLQSAGIEIGYTTVCNYIRDKQKGVNETFIRQVYEPGGICEFDWGEIKLVIGGRQERVYLAVFTSAYSNYRYAGLYRRQDSISFQESHVAFFGHLGGVFARMDYDNMRVAVSKFAGRKEKEPTQALLQMRGYYGFTHRFCNAYKGNEKGHVERSVEYVRRKAFAPMHEFDTLELAGKQLLATLVRINDTRQQHSGKTANELFADEKPHLGQLPPTPMSCYELLQLRVDKYSTISCKTNRYSVPESLTGKIVEVQLHAVKVTLWHENQCVATHERLWGRHQWSVDIVHYLETFRRKPGALSGSLALVSNRYLKSLYQEHFEGSERDFIDLLDYCKQQGISQEKMEKSVARLLAGGSGSLSAEKLKAVLGNSEVLCTPPRQANSQQEDSIVRESQSQLQQTSLLINLNN